MRIIFAIISGLFILCGCDTGKTNKNESGAKPAVSDSSLLKPDYPKNTRINAAKRKEITGEFLKKIHVPVLASLPLADDYSNAKFRSGKDVAKRGVILYGLMRAAYNANTTDEVMAYFKKYDLWNDVSGNEKKYLESTNHTKKQDNDMTWRSEDLNVLLWALGYFDVLTLPLHECDIKKFNELPGVGTDPSAWINAAKLRNTEDILNETDLIYRISWATAEARIHNSNMPFNFDEGVVYERHYTLNWLTVYADNWDDITTDT